MATEENSTPPKFMGADMSLLSITLDIARSIQGIKHAVELMMLSVNMSEAHREAIKAAIDRAEEGQLSALNAAKELLKPYQNQSNDRG